MYNLQLIRIFFISLSIILGSSIIGSGQELHFKYLGAAGWEIKDNKTVLLIDPFISRTEYKSEDVHYTDTASVKKIVTRVDYILVHHSHYDHLADVPYIAKTTGAKVIGHETTCAILQAYGIPKEQLYPVKGGEDYLFDEFSVRVIPSIHSALDDRHYMDSRTYEYRSRPEANSLKPPLQVSEFIEGGSVMFLIRFANHEILTMGSMNFVERELEGLKPDILLAGLNRSQLQLYKYNERLLRVTQYPKYIMPTHWDNFRLPYDKPQPETNVKQLEASKAAFESLSPKSKFIIVKHLESISIK